MLKKGALLTVLLPVAPSSTHLGIEWRGGGAGETNHFKHFKWRKLGAPDTSRNQLAALLPFPHSPSPTVGKLKGSKICPRWVLVKELTGAGGELASHPTPFLPQASHLVKGSEDRHSRCSALKGSDNCGTHSFPFAPTRCLNF